MRTTGQTLCVLFKVAEFYSSIRVFVIVEIVILQTLRLRVHVASGNHGGDRDSGEKMKLT